jgi:LysM repeat protein
MKSVLVFLLALSFVGCSHGQTTSVRIQKGDTLSELAMKHKISRRKLQKLNPNIRNPNLIIAGKNLKLPKK